MPVARYIAIGHVSRDVNIVKGNAVVAPGGGVFFASLVAVRLGLRTEVITKCAAADVPLFHAMKGAGVAVTVLPSPASTSCQNEYPSDNPDDRRQAMKSLATPFTKEDLKGVDFSGALVHVNPLWFGEFPPELLLFIRRRCRFLAVDMQGFVRHVDAAGAMHHRPFPALANFLPAMDLLKLDNQEAMHLCGTGDLREAAEMLEKAGAKCIIATQADRVVVRDRGLLYEARFGPYPIEGRTGRGDTVTVSYVAFMRTTTDRQAALTRAAELTTQKMQYPGPYRGAGAKL